MESVNWSSLGIEELLNADPRPAFVAEVQRVEGSSILFRNRAFLREFDPGQSDGQRRPSPEYTFWQYLPSYDVSAPSFSCGSYLWTIASLQDRWQVVSGNFCKHSGQIHHESDVPQQACPREEPKDDPNLKLWRRNHKIHDWTANTIPEAISPWSKFLRTWNWSRTPLGPMSTWSPQLRVVANLVCIDTNPAVLWWGETMASLYNESYLSFASSKHPKALGQPYRVTWGELYAIPETAATLNEVWDKCANGEATKQECVTYFLLRDTKLEEHIFHLNMLPVLGESGETVGIYQHIIEITEEQVRNRRLSTLISMADLTAGEEEVRTFFSRVIESLRSNTYDIPFALLYSVGRPSEDEDINGRTGPKSMYLEGSLGTINDKVGVPTAHEILMNDREFLALFNRSIATGDLVQFRLDGKIELQQRLREFPSFRGFGEAPEGAILCPIRPRVSTGVSGVLVMGLNTRRPYDREYSRFFRTLSYSVSTSLASILLVQEQKQLARAASERTLQAQTSEQQAKAMLAMAPVGCFLVTLEGKMLYVNESWMAITGYELSEHFEKSWMSTIHEEDRPKMDLEWAKLVEKRIPVCFDLRLKKLWEAIDPVTNKHIRGPTYVIAAAIPSDIGGKIYITGAITDISRQKWNEDSQMRQRDEALEMKRQQENFIDITSHEMRNPLSAIFQCSDLILAVLTEYQTSRDSRRAFGGLKQVGSNDLEDPIAAAIDAAVTITLCTQHQKRIIDDILCLSKIDSKLIQITPIDVQPKKMIEHALKMFDAELAANRTQMDFVVEKSFERLEVDWVKLDPGRLLQILMNLCTKAIEFTSESLVRNVRVTLGASLAKLEISSSGVKYLQLPAEFEDADTTGLPEWGDGDFLYLHIEVQDSGKGMSTEEMKLLSQRFSQVSPRTHTRYGGSGLGLFIARLLTQLQGGEIGVTSVPNGGTTFAFYIKVRRLAPTATPSTLPVIPETNIAPAETLRAKSPSFPGLEKKSNANIHILVVEDNLVNQKVLTRQLRNLGFHVDTANNGQEAIDFIKASSLWKGNETHAKRKLTLILMDIEMPVMNGNEATRCIRDFQSKGLVLSHTPIIAITANARLEQIEAFRESGMDEIVSKPFRIPELVEKMEKFVGPVELTKV